MSPAAKESDEERVLRRLDAIIALLLRSNSASISDQIKTLSSIGFKAPEIGRVVGKESNYVGAVLSSAKSSARKAGKKREPTRKAKKRQSS